MVSTSLADGLVGLGPVRGGTPRWLTTLARLGFAAKGFVYVLIATLAGIAALGTGAPTGTRGALGALRGQPLGVGLLLLTALGIGAYAVWRLASAVFNPEKRGLLRRAGYVITVVIYSGLTVEALRLALLGGTSGAENAAATHWTARLMAQPFGIILVALVAVGVALYGGYQIYKAWKADLGKDLRLAPLRRPPRRAVIISARTGLAARGIVFVLVAVFLGRAALQADPSEARGMGGSLRAIQQQPYGPYLLGAIAIGLLAYGIYQFVRARYQRIGVPH